MQVKRLFVTITILFSLLLPNFSQAQRQQPNVVSIPDANLAAAIRQEIGNVITTDTILNLTRLDAPNRGITDLTGLEHAHNLRELNLSGEYIEVEPWFVNSNTISDFSPIAGLTRLTRLNLSRCGISDVSFVSDLTQLASLDLGNNTISDISALANLKQLDQLYLWYNTISDVSPLAELKKLTWLMLAGNNISDVSPLAELKQLPGLGLGSNNISDISPLAELKKLTDLSLSGNTISDISALANLTQLDSLSLSDNTIWDVSALANLTQLTDLSLWRNTISDISALAELTQLTRLRLSSNSILDVSPIVGLNLTGTEWDRTGLDIRWNPLSYASINTHIPAMQTRGIEVAFENRTPTTLVKISGAGQQGITNTALPLPFVVEVWDQRNKAFAGVPVTFSVATGGGKLSATTVPTDAAGRAAAHLTLGRTAGTTTVRVSAAEISQPVQFTATGVLLSAPVTITDPNLREKIIEALDKPPGGTLTIADMLKLTTLAANNANIHDLTGLQHAPNLKILSLDNNNVSDISRLGTLKHLTALSLSGNNISDVSPLSVLTGLETLLLDNNNVSDVIPLAVLTQLKTLSLNNNNISNVVPLESLTQLTTLQLKGNLLSYRSLHTHIPTIQARGATVSFDARTPTTLVNISGMQGVAGTAHPIGVEVQDAHGFGFSEVPVTFTVTAGGGQLNTSRVIADSLGRAWTTLTLGLVPGKNTVRVAVPEVLRPISFSITTGDANSRVMVPDANLRTKIAETLNKARGVQLTTGDMLRLTRLEARNVNIQNLTGLEHAHNLRELDLGGEYITEINSNTISDFSPLAGLTQLTVLKLSFCGISDVSFVLGLTQLTRLDLDNNAISDISPLANLKQLDQLYLWSNTISDVSPLAELKKLDSLDLNNNSISDISALVALTQLKELRLSSNIISDISVLAKLTQLTSLDLSLNMISDVSPVVALTQLKELRLGGNIISDISTFVKLKQLTSLVLWGNTISDVSPLAELTQLNELRIGGNNISDVSALTTFTQLTSLALSDNNISDIAPLVKLNLMGTKWDRTGLDITGNPLSYASINTHIPAMQAKDIVVKFAPRVPTTLVKILGIAQQGMLNTTLPLPFVVEVLDQKDQAFAGVPVTFAVATGQGRLNATTVKTDAIGRAAARLTLGRTVGTTTVRVTATDISQPMEFTATAVLRSPPVSIPDANLRVKIAEILRKPLAGTITVTDMLKLRTLTANNAGILDLTGLQYASNLTSLTLNDNSISNVLPLAGLSQLTTLDLRDNWISDVAPLAGLTQLTTLDLRDNWILDVSSLVGLTQLRGSNDQHGLSLQGNPLSDAAVRSHIPQLQAAGVNVGFDEVSTHERPIVRIIYFRPRDRQPMPNVNTQLDRLIKDIQQFYADQMESHGFSRKTFQFETDAHGNAVVYHVIGELEDTAYHEEAWIIWDEIHEHLDRSKYIYLTALDVSSELIGTGEGYTACGVGGGSSSFNKYKGTALLPASGGCFDFGTAAHELGHAFGLPHDFRSDAYLMSYGWQRDRISQCAAEWLDVHSAFNPNQPASTAEATIEMLPPSLASPPNAIRLRFKVTDPDGLHQVQLLALTHSGGPEGFLGQGLIACKHLNGESSKTVDFVTTSLGPANNFVSLRVIDVNGNFTIIDANGVYTTSELFSVDVASLLLPSRDVSIPDPNLVAAIREEIGDAITTHTMLDLLVLDVRNPGIKDLTGLEHAHNLKALNLGGEYIAEEGDVNSNVITDLSPLSALTQLNSLSLSNTGISNISVLAGLTQLQSLELGGNVISDVSALAALTQLNKLRLSGNMISDISPLAGLTQLTYLSLGDNTISDVSALAELKKLTYLNLWYNMISDVSALAALTQLNVLRLSGNIISDISPLANLTQLTSLELRSNTISDVSALTALTQLTELRLNSNSISDISPLAEFKQLTLLRLGDNIISDISPLAELKKLTYLDLSNNIISDVSPIVELNLTGREWDRTGLDITGNPLSAASINTHIPAMRAKGIVVAFGDTEDDQGTVVQSPAKIEGPWLWVITPTGGRSGAGAAASGIDFLSEMSDGAVTESKIATEGATVGARVGDSVWTLHTLSPTDSDNINDMANAAGLGSGDIDNHVAYGSIALEAPREQQTMMHAGSNDAVKVWLNGELVHNNPVNREALNFQDQFPVTLKKGANILLVAVYEGREHWTGFFGFAADAEYTLIPPSSSYPAWDVNEDGIVDATDVSLVTAALGQKQPENPRLDVNGDGVVDGKDLVLVAEHLDEGDAPAAPSHPARPLGFTLESVERTLNILRAADDGTLTFKRGIANLERLLARFVPENTVLLHNYPNPFNPETWIPYQLAKPSEVTLHIYAVNGVLVRTLALGYQPAGVYRIRSRAAYWDGRNSFGEAVASGVYFYTLTAGNFTATRKMLIRK